MNACDKSSDPPAPDAIQDAAAGNDLAEESSVADRKAAVDRPRVDPLVLANLIEAAPGRVRKRLDKNPEAARDWRWEQTGEGWRVICDQETVTLTGAAGIVRSVESVACTCLLSPRCFHVLACLTVLELAETADRQSPSTPPEPATTRSEPEPEPDSVVVDSAMQAAATRVRDELRELLLVGGQRADLLRQSGLLRAAHGCRAVSLIRLANTVLQVLESVRRLRSGHEAASADTLATGIASALRQTRQLLRNDSLSRTLIGQARREFAPCDLRKLLGVAVEPVLTLSGYAGVVVYLQSPDPGHTQIGRELFTVSFVRPGQQANDPQWITQAYRGGIELGNQTLPAADICRRQLLVQNLTVSLDGRLGKGSSTRWAVTQRPEEQRPFSLGRFNEPLADQVDRIFAAASEPVEGQIAGWDLVAFDAVVLGAERAALWVRLRDSPQPIRLKIAIDHPALPFRQNLSLLSRCPDLALRCLGRLRLHAAGEVDLLAIASTDDDADSPDAPRLRLPDQWAGLCNVGCDVLERWNIEGIQRWSEHVALEAEATAVPGEPSASQRDGLEPLRRRQIAIALGGRHAVVPIHSETHRRDRHLLSQRHQHTAARLIDLTAIAAFGTRSESTALGTERPAAWVPWDQMFLANHLYTQAAALHHQQRLWMAIVRGSSDE